MSTEPFIEVVCPTCALQHILSKASAAKAIRCPDCQTEFIVPTMALEEFQSGANVDEELQPELCPEESIARVEVDEAMPVLVDGDPEEQIQKDEPQFDLRTILTAVAVFFALCMALVMSLKDRNRNEEISRLRQEIQTLLNHTRLEIPLQGKQELQTLLERHEAQMLRTIDLIRAKEAEISHLREIMVDLNKRVRELQVYEEEHRERALDDLLAGPRLLKQKYLRGELGEEELNEFARIDMADLLLLLQKKDQSDRVFAAFVLGHRGPKAAGAVRALSAALRDKEAAVRYQAAEALWQIGVYDCPAVVELVATLKDEDPQVRLRAADALVRIGEPAISYLRKALNDRDPLLRAGAAAVLGDIGPPAAGALSSLRIMLDDPRLEVREAAAEAIERLSR